MIKKINNVIPWVTMFIMVLALSALIVPDRRTHPPITVQTEIAWERCRAEGKVSRIQILFDQSSRRFWKIEDCVEKVEPREIDRVEQEVYK